jgi:hypothetical protein
MSAGDVPLNSAPRDLGIAGGEPLVVFQALLHAGEGLLIHGRQDSDPVHS